MGSYGKDPIGGEVDDVFGGHIADETRKAYNKNQLFTSVVAARCTGFMQWNDLYLHHLFRPPLANELRRRLRLRDSTEPLTFLEWCEMLLIAICVVWYNPEFFPPAQTAREFRELTLTLPTDGSEDTQGKVFLLNKKVDLRLLQPMTLHRLEELRKEIEAQPIEAADQHNQDFQEAKDEAEEDVAGETQDEHAKTAAFRDAVKVGDQVAILVDRDEEGMPFLIGDVIEIVSGSEPLKIHWFSPAVKKSGVTGKWTADFLPGGTEPSLECRQRDNVIPVPVVWTKKGFSKQHGGKLTKQSATLIEEWIETWEALEWDAEPDEEGEPDAVPQRHKRPSRSSSSERSAKRK